MLKKKLILVLGIIAISSSALFSQVNFHGEFVLPTKENAKPMLGVGLSLVQDIRSVDGLALGGYASYRQVLAKNTYSIQIPFMGLARYYINRSGFYPQLALGGMHYFASSKVFNTRFTSSLTRFAFNLGLGYKLDNGLDFTFSYENIVFKNASAHQLSLRLAFAF